MGGCSARDSKQLGLEQPEWRPTTTSSALGARGPAQASVDDGRIDGLRHLCHGTTTAGQCVRPEENDQVRVGLRNDHRSDVLRCRADLVGLIVSMEGVEGNGQLGPTGPPFRLLAQQPMRDVAQGTVRSPELGACEVRQLTDDGSVSVVDADQSSDSRRFQLVFRHAHLSILSWWCRCS